MPLMPGSLDGNGNFKEPKSLAKAIDDALPNKSEFGQVERRQLMIALAPGIIKYLQENTDAFKISVTVSPTTHRGTGTLTIESKGIPDHAEHIR